MPVVWASRWFDTPVPQRVAGADLITHLAEASEIRGWRVHLFGAGPGVAERARSMMLERYPSASITADSGPDRIDAESLDEAVAASIRAVDPDVLCVALGNPKQERFIATYRESIPCPVMIGVGGSLDMMVGVRRRAPMWMQRSGTEWIFRAVQEPGRLGRRYVHDVRVFGPSLFAYWRSIRSFRATQPLAATSTRPAHRFGTSGGDSEPELVVFDFTGTDCLDPRTHAAVIGTLRDSRLHGIPVTLKGVAQPLRHCFESYGTWPLLAGLHGGQPEADG
jgi:N-acetylglucosaminyldiphosphoundecaprenol N-acetyl-beta-D-mannosaminyltransferase